MARRLFIFDPPDRFVSGTLGEPGNRTFFLQARKGRAVVSVTLEKAQVAALADRMLDLLAVVESERRLEAAGDARADQGPLDEPVVEAFRVGAMALSWDATAERVVIEAQPQDESGEYLEVSDDDEEGPDLMRVHIQPDDARAFVTRAQEVLVAGRPPCPYCGQPLEATGHFCLARNGNPS